jgi:hypothetical protein
MTRKVHEVDNVTVGKTVGHHECVEIRAWDSQDFTSGIIKISHDGVLVVVLMFVEVDIAKVEPAAGDMQRTTSATWVRISHGGNNPPPEWTELPERGKGGGIYGYTCYAWAGGTFFQLCCCVSFLFWREIGFSFTYYLCT